MSPYATNLSPISDVSKYFRKNPKDFSMTFIGKSLELRIPLRFENEGALSISDTVTTLGVMDMIIDDQYQTALNILASITIAPSEMSNMTYRGIEYLVLKLKEGDTFMTSYRVIKDAHSIYVIWKEFVNGGKLPYFFDYKSFLKIFENVRELTGSGIGVSQSVFEGIVAHICRDQNDIAKQYRLTDMKKPMKLVPLNSVSQAPTGTLARLNGNYFRNEGITSALRHQVEQQQPFENLLRGIPDSVLKDRNRAPD